MWLLRYRLSKIVLLFYTKLTGGFFNLMLEEICSAADLCTSCNNQPAHSSSDARIVSKNQVQWKCCSHNHSNKKLRLNLKTDCWLLLHALLLSFAHQAIRVCRISTDVPFRHQFGQIYLRKNNCVFPWPVHSFLHYPWPLTQFLHSPWPATQFLHSPGPVHLFPWRVQ